VDGLVFAGTGAGLISCFERAALERALAARTGAPAARGAVLCDDIALVMVPAGTLNPQKARELLLLALAHGLEPADIARVFSEY
jgi:L-asparaginase